MVNTLDRKEKEGLLKRLWHGMRPNTRSELAEMIKDAGERDIIDENTEDMIRGVFDITTQRIADIMIPRSQMVTIDSRCSLTEAVKVISAHGHSRYPVTNEDKDHILGILNAKDLCMIEHIDINNNSIHLMFNNICPIGPKYKNNLMEVLNNYEYFSENYRGLDEPKRNVN